ncbi:diacylglycerol kinase [Streptomyces griseocarneus]|uniref:diacylglycerol kinase n=1 Tax=Streptomyces griseocarneus TaxID=51201 RepID=UPI00167E7282|nr:diacylglycerol kinase [Streptomyces griseocarneus]MBZ6472849.1 diacylglycerol kinase [Streptomyces griseocarneus]GHG58392.1 diacylglycerol kinase [Streptomyces griseocarneus]
MSAADPTGAQLLVVIDPAARRVDGESTRIARDVLCAGAVAKICLPNGPEEVARAVARRGRRRTVVIGDDRALLRVVGLLHRRRELAVAPLAWVPVGALPAVSVARVLGVPLSAVAAARAVLDGVERRLGLLADDSDGVVLGGLWVPAGATHRAAPHVPAAGARRGRFPAGAEAGPAGGGGDGAGGASGAGGAGGAGHQSWWSPAARTARTALTLLSGPGGRHTLPSCTRLRVEADGVLLADLDRPVGRVAVSAVEGLAEVVVQQRSGDEPVRARARAVTVSGPDFRYRADNRIRGPVRTRTWTAHPEAWRLTLPR